MTEETVREILKPEWNKDAGLAYIGKYILVGITYLDHKGNEKVRQQMHGIVESASETDGIKINLKGVYDGKIWTMPPDQRAISEASPGTYTLHMTKEKIENPDLLAMWTMQGPDPHENDV
ncbi:MAG: hypothetical protein KC590_01150 [Nitrospira sp.]|nr:hypothetical protein [Nitrospira sp.]MCA9479712.1 hypothetical protein [Nitrospira sp.]